MKPENVSAPLAKNIVWHRMLAALWCLAILGFLVFVYLRAQAQPQEASYFTEAQAQAGLLAYSQHCAACHGAELQGISGPPLAGETFLARWGTQSVASLYSYTFHRMPPGRGSTLSESTYAATVAYVLAQNMLPAGDEDLNPADIRLQNLLIPEVFDTTLPRSSALLLRLNQPPNNLPAVMPGPTQPGVVPASAGEYVYNQHCMACHGQQGEGGIGPGLITNPRLEDAAWTIRRIAIGGLGMPAHAHQLSSKEIAEVTTYIRSSFGNSYPAVSASEVAGVVAELEPSNIQPVMRNLSEATWGEQRYTQLCAACHGLQGGGSAGPPLAGNPNLSNTQNVIITMLYGRGEMPAFSLYPDRDIAAIASYIRTSWHNHYGFVDEDVVQVYRPAQVSGSFQSTLESQGMTVEWDRDFSNYITGVLDFIRRGNGRTAQP